MLPSVLRDCLFLNWALPVERLAPPPPPLRYQPHPWEGRSYTFASLLMFHRDVPLPGSLHLGVPELCLRLTVFDGDGLPSLLLRRVLLPLWVAPGMRLLGSPAVSGARLFFPRPSRALGADPWVWRIEHQGWMEIAARLDSPRLGEGPSVGNWEQTVRYFQERPRVYVEERGGARRIGDSRLMEAIWPLNVDLSGDELLGRWLFSSVNGQRPALPRLHSCWLSPEAPLAFADGSIPGLRMTAPLPQPAVGRVAVFRAAG
jgi:hypothetical protein